MHTIEGNSLPGKYSFCRGREHHMNLPTSKTLAKVVWIALIPAGIFVIIFGITGVFVANRDNLPAFLPVAYAMVLGGLALIGTSAYKISRIRAKERVYARDYLGVGEQVLGEWRYGVWVGFLRRQKILVVLTNQSLMAINQRTRRLFFEARLSDLSAVAKNRRTESHFSHSFVYLETQRGSRGPGLGMGSASGTSDGVSRVIGDIDFFMGDKLVYWITGVSDPDGVVETIRVVQKSARVA
jgi:hypothetical protein